MKWKGSNGKYLQSLEHADHEVFIEYDFAEKSLNFMMGDADPKICVLLPGV